MSKNLTRKSLAFGALVALGSTLIAGAPAQAAGSIVLNPSTGTAWNTLSTSTFSASPVITGVNADEFRYLRYLVTNTDELELRVDIKQGTTGDAERSFEAGTTNNASSASVTTATVTTGTSTTAAAVAVATGQGAKFTDGDLVAIKDVTSVPDGNYVVDVTGDSLAITLAANGATAQSAAADTNGSVKNLSRINDDKFVVAPYVPGTSNNSNAIGTANHLVLGLVDTTKATSVKVQAWIDGNQNNVIDGGESVATEQTVGFKKLSTLSASVALSGVRYNSDEITATVTLTGDINYQQVNANQVVVNIADAADISTGAPSWNTVTSAWERTVSATSTGLSAAEVVTAKVWDDANINGTATVADGDTLKVTGTATAGSAVADPTFEMKTVNAAGVVTTTKAQDDNGAVGDATGYAADQAGTAYVRTGTASFDVTLYVGSDAVTPVGADSAEVSIAVAGTNVTNTDAVTVGGKAVTNGAATYTSKTDANGNLKFTVNLGSADDADVLAFTATVTGTALSSSVLTVNVTDGTFSATQVTPGAQSIKAGEKIAIDYRVVDEFGVAPTNNTYSIVVTPTANERTTAATWSNTLQVVDGKASLSVTDNGVGDGKFVASAQLYKGASSVGSAVTTTVNVVADPVAKTITAEKLAYGTSQAKDLNNDGDYADTDEVDNTAKLLVSTKTFSNYDSRYSLPTDVAPTVTDVTKVTVGGKVTNAAGTGVAGALVTFAAKGFLFKSGTVYAQDSITVRADSTGIASVDVWSHVGGSQSIKMTSGAASAAQALVYAPAAAVAGKTIAFAPKGVSASGRAIDLTATISDVFGLVAKGVSVTFTATGVGYLSANSASTLSDGKATVKLITLAGETGAATVTAIFTDVDGVEVVTSKTIYVGVKASIVKAATSSAVVKNAKGATIKVVRGSKATTKVATSNSQKVTLKGGSGTVKVYVNGVKVASK
jgi:hypothetical protein